MLINRYREFFIVYNTYGRGEYIVNVTGDEFWFNTFREAQEFIDELYRLAEKTQIGG